MSRGAYMGIPRISIDEARRTRNTEVLRKCGRRSAAVRKRRKERQLATRLKGARDMQRQAHEDICPIE